MRAVSMAQVVLQEPSLASLWLIYGTLGLVGFLLCWYRPWLLFVVEPICLVMAMPLLMELYDPEVGGAIWRESRMYYVEAHLTLATLLGLPYLGAMRSRWKGT